MDADEGRIKGEGEEVQEGGGTGVGGTVDSSSRSISHTPKSKWTAWDGTEFTDIDEFRKYEMETHFTFRSQVGESLTRLPGEIEGQPFDLVDLDDCEVLLLDHTDRVRIDDVRNSRIFIGACESTVIVRRCTNCTFTVATRELHMKDTENCVFLLYSTDSPLIEGGGSCHNLEFGPFNGCYPQQIDHLEAAGLDPLENQWWLPRKTSEEASIPEGCYRLLSEQEYQETVVPWEPLGPCEAAIPTIWPPSPASSSPSSPPPTEEALSGSRSAISTSPQPPEAQRTTPYGSQASVGSAGSLSFSDHPFPQQQQQQTSSSSITSSGRGERSLSQPQPLPPPPSSSSSISSTASSPLPHSLPPPSRSSSRGEGGGGGGMDGSSTSTSTTTTTAAFRGGGLEGTGTLPPTTGHQRQQQATSLSSRKGGGMTSPLPEDATLLESSQSEWEEKIRKRGEKDLQAERDARAKAEVDLDAFYDHYTDQKAHRQARNRELEAVTLDRIKAGEESNGENPFARVLDLVGPTDEGKNLDLSRFRGLLISLRESGLPAKHHHPHPHLAGRNEEGGRRAEEEGEGRGSSSVATSSGRIAAAAAAEAEEKAKHTRRSNSRGALSP